MGIPMIAEFPVTRRLYGLVRRETILDRAYVLRALEASSAHIETFLALEYDEDYQKRFKTALAKQIKEPSERLSETESKDINKLEAAVELDNHLETGNQACVTNLPTNPQHPPSHPAKMAGS